MQLINAVEGPTRRCSWIQQLRELAKLRVAIPPCEWVPHSGALNAQLEGLCTGAAVRLQAIAYCDKLALCLNIQSVKEQPGAAPVALSGLVQPYRAAPDEQFPGSI